jgi:D-amino peptidase
MRVLISVDMEGLAGVASRAQVIPGASDYALGRRLMTAEANAAIEGAFRGGARSVVVNDSHGPMDNLLGEELDPRAEYVVGSPKPLSMMQEVEAGCDVALFIGYHAGPDSTEGVLAHCYSGAAFADVRVNGESVSEADLNGLVAGMFGVPVGLVTGDEQTCAQAKAGLPDVLTVAVKKGLGLTAARSLHPVTARQLITDAAAAAVVAAPSLLPRTVPAALELEVTLRPVGAAELAMLVPGTQRVSAASVRRSVADPRELLQVLLAWGHLAVVSR